MVPDIAHLFPRRGWTDHTALSVVTFSIPVGTMVFYLIERWVAPGLRPFWPQPWKAAVLDLCAIEHRPRIVGIFLGVGVGAAIHVALDHCTHAYGVLVLNLPWFFAIELLRTPWDFSVHVYQLLQQLTGMVGCWVLAVKLHRWGQTHQAQPLQLMHLRGVALLSLVTFSIALIFGYCQSWWLPFPDRLQVFLVQFAMALMVAAATGLLALSSVGHGYMYLRHGGVSSAHQSSSD